MLGGVGCGVRVGVSEASPVGGARGLRVRVGGCWGVQGVGGWLLRWRGQGRCSVGGAGGAGGGWVEDGGVSRGRDRGGAGGRRRGAAAAEFCSAPVWRRAAPLPLETRGGAGCCFYYFYLR